MKGTIPDMHRLTSTPYNEFLYRDELAIYKTFNLNNEDFGNLSGRRRCSHCGEVFASKDRMDYAISTGRQRCGTRYCDDGVDIICCKGCYKKLQEAA